MKNSEFQEISTRLGKERLALQPERDRPEFDEIKKQISKVIADADCKGNLYPETVESILDVVFLQYVKWSIAKEISQCQHP